MNPYSLNSGSHAGNLRFGGYAMTPRGTARLFLPGYMESDQPGRYRVRGEMISRETPRPIRMEHNGDYWVSSGEDELPPGTAYRILVDDTATGERYVVLDNVQTVTIKDTTYNIVSPFEQSMPRRSGPIAGVFLDRLESFRRLLRRNTEAGKEPGPPVSEIMSGLKESGFTGAYFSPFHGGDNLSDSRYAVEDPYMLNDKFGSPEAFRKLLLSGMKDGSRIFAYGAFFNQDISGVQYQANISHPFRSPFWTWFHYGDPPNDEGELVYPEAARKKQSIGILPHQDEPDYSQLDFRILNDPADKDKYRPGRPIYIEFFNPLAEQGASSADSRKIHRFRRRFRVTPEELGDKRHLIRHLERSTGKPVSDIDRKRIFSEGDHFRLTVPQLDDSGEKWNNHVPAARLDLDNPDVRKFLVESFVFWTRLARNTYVEEIAGQLTRRMQDGKADWAEMIEDLGLNGPGESGKQILEGYLSGSSRPRGGQRPGNPGLTLACQVIDEFPPASLPFPANVKAILTHPGFRKRLHQEPMRFLAESAKWFLDPLLNILRKIPAVGRFIGWLEDSSLFRPRSFESLLSDRLDEAVDLLSEQERKKLADPVIRNLLTDRLGARVYLKLLTSQTAQTPEAIGRGLEETVYDHILGGDPVIGMQDMIRFMKDRLDQLEPEELAGVIRQIVSHLDVESVALADYLVDHRELGLNWRMGSVLGVIDLEAVREKDGEEKNELFLQEVRKAVLRGEELPPFWREVTEAIRKVSPKSTLVADLDFDPTLCDWQTFIKTVEEITASDTFTAIATGANLKSNPLALVHAIAAPDGSGYQQVTPYEYYTGVLRPMTKELPFPILRQHQSTMRTDLEKSVPHSLLLNPAIAGVDTSPDRAIENYFQASVSELLTRICFDYERRIAQRRGIENLPEVLERLSKLAFSAQVVQGLSPDVRTYLTSQSRSANRVEGPTPIQVRKQFVTELFNILKPADLGLISPDESDADRIERARRQMNSLRRLLLQRMGEPGEARAMRAVIVNQMLAMDWSALWKDAAALLGDRPELLKPVSRQKLQKIVEDTTFLALNHAVLKNPQEFGHEPLENVIDGIFTDGRFDLYLSRLLGREMPKEDAGLLTGAIQGALKERLYRGAMDKVLDKLLRALAIQVAVPGNPSLDLPELFGQTGSSWLSSLADDSGNIPAGEEPMQNPLAPVFLREVSSLLKLRSRFPVLNDGQILDVQIRRDETVLPIIRDNGRDQAIMLINTGGPPKPEESLEESGGGYPDLALKKPVRRDYKLNLSNLRISPGTVYRDVENGEQFKVSKDHRLLRIDGDKAYGVDIPVYRLLIRENRSNSAS